LIPPLLTFPHRWLLFPPFFAIEVFLRLVTAVFSFFPPFCPQWLKNRFGGPPSTNGLHLNHDSFGHRPPLFFKTHQEALNLLTSSKFPPNPKSFFCPRPRRPSFSTMGPPTYYQRLSLSPSRFSKMLLDFFKFFPRFFFVLDLRNPPSLVALFLIGVNPQYRFSHWYFPVFPGPFPFESTPRFSAVCFFFFELQIVFLFRIFLSFLPEPRVQSTSHSPSLCTNFFWSHLDRLRAVCFLGFNRTGTFPRNLERALRDKSLYYPPAPPKDRSLFCPPAHT